MYIICKLFYTCDHKIIPQRTTDTTSPWRMYTDIPKSGIQWLGQFGGVSSIIYIVHSFVVQNVFRKTARNLARPITGSDRKTTDFRLSNMGCKSRHKTGPTSQRVAEQCQTEHTIIMKVNRYINTWSWAVRNMQRANYLITRNFKFWAEEFSLLTK